MPGSSRDVLNLQILALEIRHKKTNASLLRILMEYASRQLVGVSVSLSDTVGWVTGRTMGPLEKQPVPLVPKVSFLEHMVEKKRRGIKLTQGQLENRR